MAKIVIKVKKGYVPSRTMIYKTDNLISLAKSEHWTRVFGEKTLSEVLMGAIEVDSSHIRVEIPVKVEKKVVKPSSRKASSVPKDYTRKVVTTDGWDAVVTYDGVSHTVKEIVRVKPHSFH